MIRDVSIQYAALMNESVEEDKKYSEACEEACRLAKEAEEKAIDEFETDEVDLAECGFEEETNEEEITETDEEAEEKAKEALEKAKKTVSGNLDEDEVRKWLKKNQAKIEKIFSNSKFKDEKAANAVKQLMKILERYSRGELKESIIGEKKNNSVVWQLVKAILRFFNWVLMLAPKLVIGSAWVLTIVAKFALGLQGKIDKNLAESLDLEIADDEKRLEEKDIEELGADGISEAEQYDAMTVGQLLPTFEDAIKQHPYTPIHVGKRLGEYSLYGQVVDIDISGPEVIFKVVKVINGDPKNKDLQMIKASQFCDEMNSNSALLSKPVIAEVTLFGRTQRLPILSADIAYRDGLMLRTELSNQIIGDDEDIEVKESACQNEEDPVAHLLDPIGVKASTASLAGQDAVSIKVVESLLKKIDRLEGLLEAKKDNKDTCCEEEKNEEKITTETQYDDVKARQKLTYGDQLKFKRWAMRKLGLKGDPFYFDYVTGVDAKTSHDLPGLMANGSMTWGEGLDALRQHFGIPEGDVEGGNGKSINEEENPDDSKTDDFDKAGDDYEEEKDNEASLSNEADESFEEEVPSEEDSPLLKKAKAIQEISFERALTSSEEDQFRRILSQLTDYQKDLLLGNLEKTGFARPGNHTNLRAYDDLGNRVEVPPMNYTEDPEDHSQKKSIEKRNQRNQLKMDIQNAQNNAMSSLEGNLAADQELQKADWEIALGTLKNKTEKKELMDEIINGIEEEYAGKTDAQSEKDRENEITYVWKVFGYDPKTRDFGKVWKVSHVAAGKYEKKTMNKIANAFRSIGITKMSGLRTLSDQKFARLINMLKAQTALARKSKINRKEDPQAANQDPTVEV